MCGSSLYLVSVITPLTECDISNKQVKCRPINMTCIYNVYDTVFLAHLLPSAAATSNIAPFPQCKRLGSTLLVVVVVVP